MRSPLRVQAYAVRSGEKWQRCPARCDDRLEKLRLAFPAEVTAAFLAAQKLLGPSNYDRQMMYFLLALIVLNLLVYFYFYKIRSYFFLSYVSVGFFLWAVSIDSERLKDILHEIFRIDYYPTFPLLLILYTIISAYIPLSLANKTDEAKDAASGVPQ